jgi:hypothetical protein
MANNGPNTLRMSKWELDAALHELGWPGATVYKQGLWRVYREENYLTWYEGTLTILFQGKTFQRLRIPMLDWQTNQHAITARPSGTRAPKMAIGAPPPSGPTMWDWVDRHAQQAAMPPKPPPTPPMTPPIGQMLRDTRSKAGQESRHREPIRTLQEERVNMLDQERAMLYARLQDTEKRSAKARREQAEMEEREQLEEERQHEEARVAQAQNISRIEKLKRDTEAELQRLTDRQYEEARVAQEQSISRMEKRKRDTKAELQRLAKKETRLHERAPQGWEEKQAMHEREVEYARERARIIAFQNYSDESIQRHMTATEDNEMELQQAETYADTHRITECKERQEQLSASIRRLEKKNEEMAVELAKASTTIQHHRKAMNDSGLREVSQHKKYKRIGQNRREAVRRDAATEVEQVEQEVTASSSDPDQIEHVADSEQARRVDAYHQARGQYGGGRRVRQRKLTGLQALSAKQASKDVETVVSKHPQNKLTPMTKAAAAAKKRAKQAQDGEEAQKDAHNLLTQEEGGTMWSLAPHWRGALSQIG